MGRARAGSGSDAEFWDDEDDHGLDDEGLEAEGLRERLRRRVVAVFGGSYGLSVLVHLAILAVLATIVIAAPPEERSVTLMPTRPPTEPYKPTPQAELDLKETPPVPRPESEQVPHVELETELDVATETPKGTDLNQVANKHLESNQTVDAYGAGGGASGAYGTRVGKPGLVPNGGCDETEDAVLAALRWLARHQSPDGSWSAGGWQARCVDAPCRGAGAEQGHGDFDVGVSGLALLAFLGHGHTHRFSRYPELQRAVRRGLAWLQRQQAPDGSLGWRQGHGETIYCHAIATMVLAEAWAITRDPPLRRPAQRATDWLAAAQNPGLGWRYGVRPGQNDTSVTGWCVLAIKAARTGGLEVPEAAFAGAHAWVERATDTRGDAGYASPGGGSSYLPVNEGKFVAQPTNTAVGVLCRMLLGERSSADAVRKGVALVVAQAPSSAPAGGLSPVNYYFWYYGTYALFQAGGKPWQTWNAAMKAALLPAQRRDGCARGSWDPAGEWCVAGGRVYATAINALTLEIYYRYLRVEDVVEGR